MNKREQNSVIITQQDFSKLFDIHENISDLERIISKCNAMSDIFEEALESMNNEGTQFSDRTMPIDAISVIREYSSAAKYKIRSIEKELSTLNNNIRNKYMTKGGECDE